MDSGTVDCHVAIMAFPFGSHPTQLFSLARTLAAAAAAAAQAVAFTFFTSSDSAAPLSRLPAPPNLRLLTYASGGSGAGAASASSVLERIGQFIRAAPEILRAAVAAASGGEEKVSCVVSDAFLWTAGEVAEEMGVPWVPAWAGGTAALVAHLCTDELRRRFGVEEGKAIHSRADELLEIIPGTARVRDLPEEILRDTDTPFGRLLYNVGQQLPKAAAVAINTIQGLDPALDARLKSTLMKPLAIGPLNLLIPAPPPSTVTAEPDRDECLSWLDGQRDAAVAYLSFGTIVALSADELAELAEGLEESGVPFLWSLKGKENLPAGFLSRTKGRGVVVGWAPQVRVLGHRAVGAFVTHCGWNSVMESMAAGVPMVCRPCFGDHMMAERAVTEEWKVGVGLGGGVVTKEGIVKALNTVLKEGELRKRMRELKERALRAVGTGGSSAENLNTLLEVICKGG